MLEAGKDGSSRKRGLRDIRRMVGTVGTVLFIVLVQIAIAVIAVELLVLGPAIVLVLGLIAIATTLWETYKKR